MIAYNKTWLQFLDITDEADVAYIQKLLPTSEFETIKENYKTDFYTPNIFIRIGLFILTVIIVLFSFGLLCLLFLNNVEKMLSGLAIIFSLVMYGALEWMIKNKHHYRSGVDDALLWMATAFLSGAVGYLVLDSSLLACTIACLIAAFGVLRYNDRIMVAVAFVELICVIYFLLSPGGLWMKAFIPFILMAVSFCVYLFAVKLKARPSLRIYKVSLTVLIIVSLVGLYAAGNYFVVRELSISLLNLTVSDKEPIAFGWLFWLFTVAIPPIYLARGIQKKNVVLTRVGLLVTAATILTIWNYYRILSPEAVLVAGGIILLMVTYSLVKYLHIPKNGITYEEPGKAYLKLPDVESVVIAETFKPSELPADNLKFGGGSFGGGGSSAGF